MADMEFGLLGPLVVHHAGVPVAIPRGKQRAVLAALLLEAGRVVPVDALADSLWGAEPPASARVTVQNYVKRLRHVLGDNGLDRISTHPGGYSIRVVAGELDVSRFEDLVSAASTAARSGSWDKAGARAVAALSLWRGEPLADAGSEVLSAREGPRLAELRVQAAQTRLEAELHLGGHLGVVPELRRLVAVYPLREHLHALLMLALYRSQRQGEALAVFHDARRILVEELGAEPGAELREMHRKILAADPGLAAPRRSAESPAKPSSPGGMLRVRRAGAGLTQEQLAELSGLSARTISDIERGTTVRPRHSSMALIEAALGPADDAAPGGQRPVVVPRQLPRAVSGFVGRERELTALTGLLRGPEAEVGAIVISAVAGTAGVGKTALALRWAHSIAEDFPDGQLFVDLCGYDPGRPVAAADALAGFLRALGVAGQDIPAETDERSALYRSLLAGRRMLIVLDNAGSAEQVRPLLPGAPPSAVVVTSRDSLAGLVVRDGARRLDLGLLPLADAISLLQALIGDRAHAEPEAAKMLAGQCSRLPLALRLAAELATARPAVPLTDLVSELADEQRRLNQLDIEGDPRTAVRAVFSWSYQHLETGDAKAFRLLGLHTGPRLDRYEAAALTDTSLERADQALAALTRAHLIQPAGAGRHHMHDLLRAYARELATTMDSGAQRQAALTRLFDHYLHATAVAMDAVFPAEQHHRPSIPASAAPVPPLTAPASARAWLDGERACLVAAVAHAADHGWLDHATRLAATVFRYLEAGGYYQETVTIYTHVRHAARRDCDRAAEAEALNNLTIADLRHGRYQQASVKLRQSLALHRQTGNQTGQARALGNLGITAMEQGQYDLAASHHQQALALYRSTADPFGEARTLLNLSLVDLRQGHYERAAGNLQQALTLSGEGADVANCLANLGVIDLRQGHYEKAAGNLQQAMTLSRQGNNPANLAFSLANLGLVDLRQGRYRQSRARLRQALALSHEIGDQSGMAEALNGLGEVFLAIRRPSTARAQHGYALSLASKIGDIYEQARAHNGLAQVCQFTGDHPRAHGHWREALAIYASLGAPETDQIRARLAAGKP